MKIQAGNDRDGYFIVLTPEKKKDYYQLGCMSKQITHNMTWANQAGDDGDFKPIQMKIYLDMLLTYLTNSERTT